MLDIGFTELLVIGALALIVVGPKELPGLLRTVGQYVGKARAMARDFQRSMEDAAREADLGDVADAVKKGGKLNKLPFDNQVVNSLKDFERSVKSEVNDAARVGRATTAAPAAVPAKKAAPVAAPKPTAEPATPKPAVAPAAPKPAAEPAPAATKTPGAPSAPPSASPPSASPPSASPPSASKTAPPSASTTAKTE
ncbi:MAG: Sec-independent protein translocase protein TatB [Paracoccaceae bacterium]